MAITRPVDKSLYDKSMKEIERTLKSAGSPLVARYIGQGIVDLVCPSTEWSCVEDNNMHFTGTIGDTLLLVWGLECVNNPEMAVKRTMIGAGMESGPYLVIL